MKKTHFMFSILMPLLAMALISCDPIKPEPEPVPVQDTIIVTPLSMNFPAADKESEPQLLVIKSEKYVSAIADDAWCKLTIQEDAPSGEYRYMVRCQTNVEPIERSTTIRIKRVSQEMAAVSVTQAAADTTRHISGSPFMGLGWCLGNQFDAHNNGKSSETAWGNPACTQATFDGLKKMGFETVRIPVTWMGHIGDAPDYIIEEAWLNRVAEVVGFAENAGLNVILNIHHDGADSKYWLSVKDAASSEAKNTEITAELTAIWGQIATRFADKGDWLMFETMNEIHDGGWGWGSNKTDGGKQYRVLNAWNQACVDVIRAAGGCNATRWIGCPGYCTNTDLTIESFVLPTDAANRVAVSIHCYDPYAFTLECSTNKWGTDAEKAALVSTFAKIKQHYIDQGIEAYIGEFGCAQRANPADEHYRVEYLAYYAAMAYEYNLSIMLWDNGSKSAGGAEANSFVNHGTGEYMSDKGKAAVEALVDNYK